jgi:hypothetical protein
MKFALAESKEEAKSRNIHTTKRNKVISSHFRVNKLKFSLFLVNISTSRFLALINMQEEKLKTRKLKCPYPTFTSFYMNKENCMFLFWRITN